jgi:hypothetical protein
MGKSIVKLASCSAACLLLSLSNVQAVELGTSVELHGYGAQNYLRTSDNVYRGADRHGTLSDNLFAMVGTLTLSENSKLWAQLEHERDEGVRLDWFFADYRFNEHVRVQVGRAKLPFGIQNETIDAQYLQLSAVAPFMYQESAHMTSETFQGVALDYEAALGATGALRAQVWGGDFVQEAEEHEEHEEEEHHDRRIFGGRLVYSPPVDGLKLMLSAFRVQVETEDENNFANEDRQALSLDYTRQGFELEAEYAAGKLLEVEGRSYYVQAGYTFAEKWTPYLRYDYVATDDSLDDDPSFYQRALVLGVGYRIGSNFSLRAEDHINRGYGLPVAEGELEPGEGDKDWHLFAISVNFIF